MSLEVLYEDKHLIVVKKPANVLSQADISGDLDLLTMVKNYLKIKENKQGEAYVGLVHRLDRMTSGIMVFAKRSKAAARLSSQIANHEFKKTYLALVEGQITENGHLENYLWKDELAVKSMITSPENGKIAILDYQVIKSYDDKTLLSIDLLTGRHHQIRVQFANISHPVVGDRLYGATTSGPLCLHACKIVFKHPMTAEEMVFEDYEPAWLKSKKVEL